AEARAIPQSPTALENRAATVGLEIGRTRTAVDRTVVCISGANDLVGVGHRPPTRHVVLAEEIWATVVPAGATASGVGAAVDPNFGAGDERRVGGAEHGHDRGGGFRACEPVADGGAQFGEQTGVQVVG